MSATQSAIPDRPNEILQAIERLSNPDLDSVLQRAQELRAERMAPHLSVRETELLTQINEGASDETWARYRDLRSRRDSPAFTASEHQELLDLYDVIELQHSRRISAVVDLAQLRKQSVEELMDILGLVSPGCE